MRLLPVGSVLINLKPSLTIATPLKLLQHDHVLLQVMAAVQFLTTKLFLTAAALNSCSNNFERGIFGTARLHIAAMAAYMLGKVRHIRTHTAFVLFPSNVLL